MKWDERLAMKLLHLKHVAKNPKLAAWIEELPRSFSTPLGWSEAELQALQYEAIGERVATQSDKWAALHARWAGESAAALAPAELTWALQCINSRAFSGPFEGSTAAERRALLAFTSLLAVLWPLAGLGTVEQSVTVSFVVVLSILLRDVISLRVSSLKRYVVCPFVDMFNHKSSCTSDASYNYFTGQFQLFTSPYKQGEHVFVSYGKQSNDRLLQYYGFVEPGNPNDVYELNLGFVDLAFKYGDDLAAAVEFPAAPSPEERLKVIAAALRGTQIQLSDDASSSTTSALDFKCRISRALSGSVTGSVDDLLAKRRSAIRFFDDVAVRSMRALLSSEQEWQQLCPGGSLASLRALDEGLSIATERKLAAALSMIARLELASKETTLDADLAALDALKGGEAAGEQQPAKGFKSQEREGRKKPPRAVRTTVDPSGDFQSKLFTALSFRIEKKTLLLEASNAE